MRIRRFLYRAVLSALPPLLFGIYQRFPEAALIPYYVLLPWVWLYTDPKTRTPVSWYIFSCIFTWAALHPMAGDFGIGGWMGGLVFVWPWFPVLPLIAYLVRNTGLPRVFLVPLVWTAGEWFRATFTLSHFDLFHLGYTQARFTPIVQIADIFGSYGVSFLVASAAGLMADFGFAWRDGSFQSALNNQRVRVGALVLASLWGLTIAYGFYRIQTIETVAGPKLAVIQPSIRHTMNNAYGVHLTQWEMTEDWVEPGSVDLIVWPENAILDFLDRPGIYRKDLAVMLGRLQAPLLLGSLGEAPGEPGRTRNAAFLLDQNGSILQRYDKQVLYPWSEYIPGDAMLARWAPFLRRPYRALVRGSWGFIPVGTAGNEMVRFVLETPSGPIEFAVLICVENTYSEITSQAGREGIRMIVNITSEGEVGGTIQEQLLRICMMRAVENRIAYIRAGNTGISGFIDPAGRLYSVLQDEKGQKIGTAGELSETVRLGAAGVTLHARSRDAFVKICLAITILLWVRCLFSRFRGRTISTTAILMMLVLTSGCSRSTFDGMAPSAVVAAVKKLAAEQPGDPRIVEGAEIACGDEDSCRQVLGFAGDYFSRRSRYETGALFFRNVGDRHENLKALTDGYRGWMLTRSSQFEEALEAYEAAILVQPEIRFQVGYGKLLAQIREWDRAADVFENVWRQDPSHKEAAFLYARALYLSGGEPVLVRTVAESLLRQSPEDARALTLLGRLRDDSGDHETALARWHQAAEMDSGHLESRYLLARSAMNDNDRERADRWIGEIRSIESELGKAPVLEEGS